jgi:uncharacterized repeat protein (TIGR04138 family)
LYVGCIITGPKVAPDERHSSSVRTDPACVTRDDRRSRAVTELAFRDGIMEQIKLREPRFDERAYLFVLAALEHCQTSLIERRHITGPELARSCREVALQRFGVMARLVLEHWGVRETIDIGDIVFTLVDMGLLISQPQDTRDDFFGIYEFETAFEHEYPWSATHV